MFQYFKAAKILRKETKAQVDNTVFHLHYRVTFLVFLVASGLVTAREFFGSPIQCFAKKIQKDVLESFCYIMATFSVPKHFAKGLLGPNEKYHHGVGPFDPAVDEVVYHAYYQWVPFMLLLQALMFYCPRYIWKNLDDGVFTTILGGLEKSDGLDRNSESCLKKHKSLTNYMMTRLNTHRSWAFKFFFCEVLNFGVVLGNIYFIDHFLGGTFLTYGTDVMSLPGTDPENRTDPMQRIFPRVTKCTFRHYGPSGTIEVTDALCILAINIINEKIYLFIWFWLMVLVVVTGVWLIYRATILVSPYLRTRLLKMQCRWIADSDLTLINKKCNVGDWFLIYHLSKNMQPVIFGDFLKEFARALENTIPTLERKPMFVAG